MLDVYDKLILDSLQSDGKITVKELSEKINLSSTPVFERIRKLEKEGYITGYHAKLDKQKLGLSLMVICNVSLKTHQKDFIEIFQKEITKFDEVKECFHIAGMYDYLLKVIVKDMEAYQHFVSHKLASLENIGNVQSSFVMKELKDNPGYNV